MYEIPTSVTVKDRVFPITNKGDYRMVLDCFSALQDEELEQNYRIAASLEIFYTDINSEQDLLFYKDYTDDLTREMFKFINCGQNESPGAERDVSLINWEDDSQMICAAVNNVAKCEIRSIEYMHWWTFLGYYMSVGQSVLSTVVGIRDKIKHGKKLEKWEKDFKKDNPGYFTKKLSEEEESMEDYIRNLWK